MKNPVKITEKQNNGKTQILVDSIYYNDNQIYTKSLNKDNE